MRWILLVFLALAGCDDAPAQAVVDATPTLDGAVGPDAALDPDAALEPDPDGAPDAAPEPDAAPDAAPETTTPLEWRACPQLAGQRNALVECAERVVPLRRDVPEAGDISLFVKRIRPDDADGRSLWILAGGPGQAGDELEGLGAVLAAAEPRLTIYLPDHRGTGRSTRLSCPEAEAPGSPGGAAITDAEWPGCHREVLAVYGEAEHLRGFGTTEAAHDLVELIDASGEGTPYVLGVSYGTFLAWRYLQVAPSQAAGVIFDSACHPSVCHLSAQDLWEDGVGRAWFDEVCGQDATCAEKLGLVPSAAVQSLHDALQAGHCPLLGEDPVQARATLRAVLGQMLFFANLRPALPAFVYRLARCSPEDQQAIVHMFDALFGGPGGGGSGSYSWPLAMNILVSEMWEPSNPSPAELDARYENTLMCRGVSALVAHQAPAWTRYSEPLTHQPLVTELPTLILQAEYDPATPVAVAEPMAAALDGPHQRFVVVPHASHTVVAQSVMADNLQQHCGTLLLQAFLADPTGPLPDCTGGTLPPRFPGRGPYNMAIFGTEDLWEN